MSESNAMIGRKGKEEANVVSPCYMWGRHEAFCCVSAQSLGALLCSWLYLESDELGVRV